MDNEDKILNYISKNQHTSQRELAFHTGLSLGNINLLIKKMVEKGLLKIEKFSANTLRYILTPKGFAEMTQRTYRYLLDSSRYMLNIKQQIEYIIEEYQTNRGYVIYLYGVKDDIWVMLRQMTGEGKLRQLQWIENFEELFNLCQKELVVVWQNEVEEQIQALEIECINILEFIQ